VSQAARSPGEKAREKPSKRESGGTREGPKLAVRLLNFTVSSTHGHIGKKIKREKKEDKNLQKRRKRSERILHEYF